MTATLHAPVQSACDQATFAVAADELLGRLSDLQGGLRQLLDIAGEKLDAMRRADAPAMLRCAVREGPVLHDVFAAEGRYKASLARVAQVLHPGGAGAPSLSEVIEHVAEPARSSLRARSEALREIARELQRKNRIAACAAQNLQSHVRGIFAALACAQQENTVVYGPHGKQATPGSQTWVDAVG